MKNEIGDSPGVTYTVVWVSRHHESITLSSTCLTQVSSGDSGSSTWSLHGHGMVNLFQVSAMLAVLQDAEIKPRSGELRTQKLKSHLMRTQSLNILSLKPGVGQCIAIHATLTARDSSLLISTLPVHSPAFFPKPLPIFFLRWPAE